MLLMRRYRKNLITYEHIFTTVDKQVLSCLPCVHRIVIVVMVTFQPIDTVAHQAYYYYYYHYYCCYYYYYS